MSLILHRQYGANPSLGVCFWCGEPSGDVLLLGRNRGRKAERYTIASYDPCDACKESWSRGIVLIKVFPNPLVEGQTPLQAGAYPNGDFAVVRREAITAQDILGRGMALISPVTWHEIGLGDG